MKKELDSQVKVKYGDSGKLVYEYSKMHLVIDAYGNSKAEVDVFCSRHWNAGYITTYRGMGVRWSSPGPMLRRYGRKMDGI